MFFYEVYVRIKNFQQKTISNKWPGPKECLFGWFTRTSGVSNSTPGEEENQFNKTENTATKEQSSQSTDSNWNEKNQLHHTPNQKLMQAKTALQLLAPLLHTNESALKKPISKIISMHPYLPNTSENVKIISRFSCIFG